MNLTYRCANCGHAVRGPGRTFHTDAARDAHIAYGVLDLEDAYESGLLDMHRRKVSRFGTASLSASALDGARSR